MVTSISLPSVQSLLVRMDFGNQPLSSGTAFVCESSKGPVLLTNWHNVSGRHPSTKQPLSKTAGIPDKIRIVHNHASQLGTWIEKIEPLYNTDGSPRWIEHPSLGDSADFVALPLTDLVDVRTYPYDPDQDLGVAVQAAEAISVVGFPFGMQAGGSFAIWATGFVASEPQINYNNLPIFLIDCRTRPGQSGSAVIMHRNGGSIPMRDGGTAVFAGSITQFMGIYSGRLNDQSDIGMVWKAGAVAELLNSI